MEATSWLLASGGTFLLGIQTAISPCPLTTNIAAISYIGKNVGRSKEVLFSGVLYTLGRSVAYVVLAILILRFAMCAGEQLTRFFQTAIHAWLGPILILVGMLLLGMISFSLGSVDTEKMQQWTQRFGVWSAFPIGLIFALAFCPTSAATFLTTLGLAAKVKSTFVLPTIFGVGTALPVLTFAIVLTYQAQWLGKAFNAVEKIDRWSRTVAGTAFIVIGIWLSLKHNFEIV